MRPRPTQLLAIAPTRRLGSTLHLQCARVRRLHAAVHPTATPSPIQFAHRTSWRRTPTAPSPIYQILRYASTTLPKRRSTTAAAARSPPPPTVPTKTTQASTILPHTQWNPKLNPPAETYAPPLDVPARKSDQNYLSWLWTAGRTYVAFYKTGIKRVRSTYKMAKEWDARMKAAAAKSTPQSQAKSPDSLDPTSSVLTPPETAVTRAQWQVIRRSHRDILRVPFFAVLLLIFGEWIPLIVIWITPVVPESCRIPTQVTREQTKKETRRRERERRLGYKAQGVPRPQAIQLDQLKDMDSLSLLTLSVRLDAHSKIWDLLAMTPPKGVLRWGVQRRLTYLLKDDAMIKRDGGWQGLGREEVQRACVERGFDVLGKNEGELRKALGEWYAKA